MALVKSSAWLIASSAFGRFVWVFAPIALPQTIHPARHRRRSCFNTAAEAEAYYNNLNLTATNPTPTVDTMPESLMGGDAATEWLSFLLMTIGEFAGPALPSVKQCQIGSPFPSLPLQGGSSS